MIFIPAAAFILLYISLSVCHRRESGSSRFLILCYTILIWTVILYGMTELLSCFHMITAACLAAAWAAVCIVLLAIAAAGKQRWRPHVPAVGAAILPIAALAVYMLILAYRTVPYNWDSLAYHLPRIYFWAQNRSVAHYATNDVRQLASPVTAEFINLHVYLLTGRSDRLFNLLQCVSYLFGGSLVYQIARELGCRKVWSYTAMVMYFAVPILFAEALTTQVELVAMVWLLIFVYLWILAAKAGHLSDVPGSLFLMMGICIGLGYETKPSVCVGEALFTLLLLVHCFQRKDRTADIFRCIVTAVVPAVLIILPEIARNLVTFGSISNEQVGARQLIGRKNPRYVLTNFVKNFCYNLPTDVLHDSGTAVTNFVHWFASKMHVDLNDPSIAESGMEYTAASVTELSNDRAINPLPVWSMMVACVAALGYGIRYRVRPFRGVRKHFLWGSVLSFLLMMALIRWEPYEVRYETAYLALLCPMIALVGDAVTRGRQSRGANGANVKQPSAEDITEGGRTGSGEIAEKVRHPQLAGAWIGLEIGLSVMMLVNLLVYHTNIQMERAGSRPDGYFVYLGGMEDNLKWMTESVKEHGWKTVGLYPMNSYPEYPILAMMEPYVDRFGYVIYEPDHYANVSMYRYDDPDFKPDCIIWLRDLPEETYTFHGVTYDQYEGGDGYYILYPSK